ncbi:MAG: TlpA disulfide reductase family protein [Chloroflexota bacterium]|nr:TlpA disulfide reductase family protein [Chloroflexota bacterium]
METAGFPDVAKGTMTSTLDRSASLEPSSPTWTVGRLIGIGFVFAVAIALLGLLGYGLLVSGKPRGNVPLEPRPARPFTLRLFDGSTLSLDELRGRPVLVNFWASWCGPCIEEAPVLERAAQRYASTGLVLVGVGVWDSEQNARAFIQRHGITYPNGLDPTGAVAIDYGVGGVPESFFIDRNGMIVRKWVGPLTDRQIALLLDELTK